MSRAEDITNKLQDIKCRICGDIYTVIGIRFNPSACPKCIKEVLDGYKNDTKN